MRGYEIAVNLFSATEESVLMKAVGARTGNTPRMNLMWYQQIASRTEEKETG
jgi:hypothetical protein